MTPTWTILVCINRRLRSDQTSCAARGSEALADALEAEVRARGLALAVERAVCMGRCMTGPTVRLAPGGAFHPGLTPADVPGFLDGLEQTLGLEKESREFNDLPPPGT